MVVDVEMTESGDTPQTVTSTPGRFFGGLVFFYLPSSVLDYCHFALRR